MPVAYLRIVCAKIAGTGKFSVQEIFSFNGEKFLCTNFFTEKQINEPAERKNSPEKNAAARRKAWEERAARQRSIGSLKLGANRKHESSARSCPVAAQGKLMSREY